MRKWKLKLILVLLLVGVPVYQLTKTIKSKNHAIANLSSENGDLKIKVRRAVNAIDSLVVTIEYKDSVVSQTNMQLASAESLVCDLKKSLQYAQTQWMSESKQNAELKSEISKVHARLAIYGDSAESVIFSFKVQGDIQSKHVDSLRRVLAASSTKTEKLAQERDNLKNFKDNNLEKLGSMILVLISRASSDYDFSALEKRLRPYVQRPDQTMMMNLMTQNRYEKLYRFSRKNDLDILDLYSYVKSIGLDAANPDMRAIKKGLQSIERYNFRPLLLAVGCTEDEVERIGYISKMLDF
jgi:hypothetical protein